MVNVCLTGEIRRYYADSEDKAENIVLEAKEEFKSKIKRTIINKKNRKGVEYFLIEIEIAHNNIKEIVDEVVELYGN